MVSGELLYKLPSSVAATVVKYIDVITPMQCPCKSLRQYIRLVLNQAHPVDFHNTLARPLADWRNPKIRHPPDFCPFSVSLRRDATTFDRNPPPFVAKPSDCPLCRRRKLAFLPSRRTSAVVVPIRGRDERNRNSNSLRCSAPPVRAPV